MKTLRHPWLALFLVFCLPAQALASVLIECELHVSDSYAVGVTPQAADSMSNGHHNHPVTAAPDCHGASVASKTAQSAESAVETPAASATNAISNTDTNPCFHCNGTCQNYKPLSLAAKLQPAQIFDHGAFSRLSQATEAGVHSNPSRPPCPPALS